MGAAVRLDVTGADGAPGPLVFREPATVVVGRAPDCDLRAPADDRGVSRRHCAIDIDPPALSVRDLDSRNGTYVNGVRIRGPAAAACALTDGDRVRVGGLLLCISASETGTFAATTTGSLSIPPNSRTPADSTVPSGDRTRIDGYDLLRALGRGAQGVVHLARRRSSGELLALKVLRAEPALRPDAVHGFLREIENTRALRHPNLVEFRDAGSTGALLYFTSEYCEGGDVGRWIADRGGGPLAPGEAVDLTLQVLDGLAHAHSAFLPAVRDGDGCTAPARGLVHRDIKPQNLLLSGPRHAPVVKVADFGLAKAFERAGLSGHTRTGALGGSVAFMPRAQIVNYKYAGPAVDVWAAAACLYWMLTGAVPRTFPDDTDPVAAVLREPVVPVRERGIPLPTELARLIDGILTDDDPRDKVTPSAREFAHALEAT